MVGVSTGAEDLAERIDAVIATWVVRCVTTVAVAWFGSLPPEVALAAEQAGQAARSEVGAAVRALLREDVDRQADTPLNLLRAAVRFPTGVLVAAGVPPVERDRFAEEVFPHDVYALVPATWADVDPSLADPGLAWSVAKVVEHRRRHQSGGSGAR